MEEQMPGSDRKYEDYEDDVCARVAEDFETMAWKAAGKYKRQQEGTSPPSTTGAASWRRATWVPVYYPGCTVLAIPYPLDCPSIASAQAALADCTDDFAPVPEETLHVTLADLVSGGEYQNLLVRDRNDLLDRACAVAHEHGSLSAADVRLVGLGAFSSAGVVIGVLSFDKAGYDSILVLRERIYNDPILRKLGVHQRFPFLGHITLGYLETLPSPDFIRTLHRLRGLHGVVRLSGADVFTFKNMSLYTPACDHQRQLY